MWEKRLAALGELYPGEKFRPPINEGATINLHAESKGLIATPEEALIPRPDKQYALIAGGATADIGWTSYKASGLQWRDKDSEERM